MSKTTPLTAKPAARPLNGRRYRRSADSKAAIAARSAGDGNDRFRALFERARVGMMLLDVRGRVLEVNPKFCELLGYSRAELLRSNLGDITHPEDVRQERTRLKRLLAKEVREFSVEKRYVCKGGKLRWMRATASLATGRQGRAWWISVAQDITERKELEAALRACGERLQLAAAATNSAIWDYDLSTGTVEVSELFAARFGRPATATKAWEWWVKHIHPDDRAETLAGWRDAVAGTATEWSCEYRFRSLDGVWAQVLDQTRIVRDEAGNPRRVVAALMDPTLLRSSEQALKDANERLERRVAKHTSESIEELRLLETFFDHSLDPLVLLDRDFNFIRVSDAYAKACHRSPLDFPGRNYFELYRHTENRAIFEKVVLTGAPACALADPFLFPDHPAWGITYWDWTLTPVLNKQGGVDSLLLSLRDVTLRKRMERSLQESEERYRSLVTASAQIVWMTDAAGHVVQELPSWEAFTGQSRQEYQGSGWLNALHPEDRDGTVARWNRATATRGPYETEYRLRRRDGGYRCMAARGVPILEADGLVREWVGTCTDITERDQAERHRKFTNELLALFTRKSSLKEYLDSVVEVIQQWSGSQALGIRIVDENLAVPYASCVGFPPDFLELESGLTLGRDNCCCLRAISAAYAKEDRRLVTAGGSFRCEDLQGHLVALDPPARDRLRGACTNFGFASLALIPVRYRGKAIGVIHLADRRPGQFPQEVIELAESISPLIGEAVHRFQAEAELTEYRDRLEELVQQRTAELAAANHRLQVEIAERNHAQETLQQIAQELRRSNADLEQFAYVASHDLQEPLRAVGGYVRLLQHRFPAQLDAKALEYISGAADGAQRMERLIADLLAFSRVGTRGGRFVKSDMAALLQAALANLEASIQASAAVISHDPLPSLFVDPGQIVQLFQNLIGNALKFRSDRPPRIEVTCESRDHQWVFAVRDNGIGIEPQYFQKIFQLFQRLHTRRQYAGTGIGLALCRKIAERHGGAIWVESVPGTGSTFYFSIPAGSANNQAAT